VSEPTAGGAAASSIDRLTAASAMRESDTRRTFIVAPHVNLGAPPDGAVRRDTDIIDRRGPIFK
jgi:hypothetical protein